MKEVDLDVISRKVSFLTKLPGEHSTTPATTNRFPLKVEEASISACWDRQWSSGFLLHSW
jgi:hypothetical protein